jgi:SAM-dependent methyltransferase
MNAECNVCGTKTPQFTDIRQGLGAQLKEHGFPYSIDRFETLNTKNYACSSCGSGDRDRIYKLYYDTFLSDKKINMVDFAPARALEAFFRSKKGVTYRSADLFMKDVDDKVDIHNMKIYKDNQFDFFICSHIMEHVTDDVKAMKELGRILKADGRGIIMTPIMLVKGSFDEDVKLKDVNERWRRFAQDDHVRLYEKKVFLDHLHKADLLVEQVTWKQLGLRKMLKYGISPKSVLYVVRKGGEHHA